MAGKTLKTSQTDFLRERNPFLAENSTLAEFEEEGKNECFDCPSSISGEQNPAFSANSNFNHLHPISSIAAPSYSSSASYAKPPMRPLPHKISQLTQCGSPAGKPASSQSSSSSSTSATSQRTAAVNPYLPSGSPGLIRRHRFLDSNAVGDPSTSSTALDMGMAGGGANDMMVRVGPSQSPNDRRLSNQSQDDRRLSNQSQAERRLSNQSQSSIDSAHSSLHFANSTNSIRSSSPSPAKAKPPPPPRRSSLCKSDKNFI